MNINKLLSITVSISTHPTAGFHCGCSFQCYDLCPESHTTGGEVTIRGFCCSQKISGEKDGLVSCKSG